MKPKKLSYLLQDIAVQTIHGSSDAEIAHISVDSREVGEKGLFFAVPGNLVDGHSFIDQAIHKGASAVVCEKLPETLHAHVTYVQVVSVHEVVGLVASAWYDHPARHMKIIGVTGTNGKTTTATVLSQLLVQLGHKVGLLSTVENKIGDVLLPSQMTTPDAVNLHRLLHEMHMAGCTHVCMEVSSHALDQGRVAGIPFVIACFMNITHDHLDYHGTFENYLLAKKKLFDTLLPGATALLNADDANTPLMAQDTQAYVAYFSIQTENNHFSGDIQFEGKILANTFQGLTLLCNGKEVHVSFIGSFNAYNILAVYAMALLLQESEDKILSAMQLLHPPKGRFMYHEKKGRIGIIDYAHTPDAIKNVLQTIQDIKSLNQRIITVLGCGGDRDKTKRGPMAMMALTYSDIVIFTSDNPRNEDPHAIIDNMIDGVSLNDSVQDKYYKIVDRREAIRRAVQISRDGDVILVAGKGHETYQEIKGVRYPFDDGEVLSEELEK